MLAPSIRRFSLVILANLALVTTTVAEPKTVPAELSKLAAIVSG